MGSSSPQQILGVDQESPVGAGLGRGRRVVTCDRRAKTRAEESAIVEELFDVDKAEFVLPLRPSRLKLGCCGSTADLLLYWNRGPAGCDAR